MTSWGVGGKKEKKRKRMKRRGEKEKTGSDGELVGEKGREGR